MCKYIGRDGTVNKLKPVNRGLKPVPKTVNSALFYISSKLLKVWRSVLTNWSSTEWDTRLVNQFTIYNPVFSINRTAILNRRTGTPLDIGDSMHLRRAQEQMNNHLCLL